MALNDINAATPGAIKNSNCEWYVPGDCFECKAGEHDDMVTGAEVVIVRDPDTGKMHMRAKLCSDHISIMLDDGYTVTWKDGTVR
jgi:hypothetical protein